eukprot:COSAG02_NODE_3380_length_6838_cov_9.133699_6_plen_278_part_00
MMPVTVGLLDGTTGAEIVPTTLLTLTALEESFTFDLAAGMEKSPVLSAMRGFSAPVYSEVVGQTADDLAFLMEHDTDSFNRWDASQALATQAVLSMLGVLPKSDAAALFIAAATASLVTVADPETTEDLALIALTITIPSENVLAEAVKAQGVAVDPTAVHAAREQLKNAIATANIDALQQVYRAHRTDYSLPFELSTRAVGARALCGMVLQYLCATSQASATAEVCAEQLAASNNMTDELSGACILCSWHRKQTFHFLDPWVRWCCPYSSFGGVHC